VGSHFSQEHACSLGAYHRLETRSQRRPQASNISQNLPQTVTSADLLSVDGGVTESVATIRNSVDAGAEDQHALAERWTGTQ
jgi:hypothetical protein